MDFLHDLNACHEMEEMLTVEESKTYVDLFDSVCGGELEMPDMADSPQQYLYWCVHATAAQRCEAFLRVKGLWKEEK
jgi:hypothetical protein